MNSEHWKHRRNLFNPSFHKQVLNGFYEEFNTKGDALLEKLEKVADGKTVITLLDEFNRTTLDVIATVNMFALCFFFTSMIISLNKRLLSA